MTDDAAESDDLTARIVSLKDEKGLSWNQIAEIVGVNREAARSRYRNTATRRQPPTCTTVGVTVTDELPDEDEVYRQAVTQWERTQELEQRKAAQRLEFSHGPVALAWVADHHLGGPGVDYPRVFAEAEIIRDTPGMFVGTVGDLLDGFIINYLLKVRLGECMSIIEEFALVRRYLRIIGPKLRISVSGNHDWWFTWLTGVDYFREVLAGIAPGVIYDAHDCRVTVRVGEAEFRGRIRHKWRGRSIYNPTHGAERAAKWDQDFDWAVGAHTHACGVARGFTAGGRNGLAVQCGSYKVVDDYARRGGFPMPNKSTAVTIVFDEGTRSMTGFENLEFAARFMRRMYSDGS